MIKQRNTLLFLSVQLLFVFLHIHKHISFMKTSFDKQKKERYRDQLLQQRDFTLQQLQTVQHRANIKAFALTELQLQPIRLNQIKRFSYEHIV